ncbi:hypothetical protein HZU67_08454 [Apis mellifera carnica]|nr:hypothetical protein HZU67_08454 [Apis mellifera carnica]
METSTDNSPITKVGSDEPISFKVCSLKRSKSVGNVIEQNDRNELFMRRSNSLQSLDHLTNRLKSADRIDALQESIDPQRPEEDIVEDIMDDSEPEAMIVDIEDVIEETASPLERVQPHQTPVYSVAASETTSIAVPLGTVTSSHEPSPVFLIEIEENSDSKRWESKKWNRRKSVSSEDSLSLEQSEMAKSWDNERNSSSNVDSEHWSSASSWSKRETFDAKENVDNSDRELDKDSVKSNSSIYSTDVDTEFNVVNEGKEQNQVNFEREDVPVTLPEKKDALERNLKESDDASNEKEGQQQELAAKEKRMEHFLNDYNELSNGSRPDRVKSASAGMINVDPDTFVRLTETSRGCESLPRSISKQPQPLGSLAKIVNKLKFARLIRGKDAQEENMSTISKLCRQSLLIDVRNDFDKCWESDDREKVPRAGSVEKNKRNE